jgi:hypothetical protein
MAEVGNSVARVPTLGRFLDILDSFASHAPAQDIWLNAKRESAAARSPTPVAPLPNGQFAGEIPLVEVGREFVTPVGGHCVQVLKFAGQGKRAKVYQAIERASGRTVALKVIHKITPVQLNSIALETAKADVLVSHHLPCARIIEAGATYVLKEWIEGISGEQWVREWTDRGAAPDDPAFLALLRFFREASTKGIHVNDLRPSNMILRDGSEWVPVDPGFVDQSLPPFTAMKRYQKSFFRRWLRRSRNPCSYVVYWIWRLGKNGSINKRSRPQKSSPM